MSVNNKSPGQDVIAVPAPGSDSDLERVANEKAIEDGSIHEQIDPAVERRLVWKTDLLLMPALGKSLPL